MIATSKMRRAQERGTSGRPYSEKIWQVITDLASLPGTGEVHPLLDRRLVKKITIVHITPDRGMCGGLIANMNHHTGSFIREENKPASLICVGRKGAEFMKRSGRDVRAEFTWMGDHPGFNDTLPISRIIMDDYTNTAVDAVYIAYSRFVSVLSQRPVIEQILPAKPADPKAARIADFIYEPDPKTVLGGLLPRFVEMQVYHAVLESIASEQAARMVAMRNATDNADELIEELTLAHNKARQEAITKELLDISGGVEALNR
jgi:F-type H+-transporting ATPase subunit gamma